MEEENEAGEGVKIRLGSEDRVREGFSEEVVLW